MDRVLPQAQHELRSRANRGDHHLRGCPLEQPHLPLLASRPFVALGEASYSIYLNHCVVFMGIVRTNLPLLSAPAPNLMIEVARFSAILATIFAVSMISYTVIEVPARRWLRGLWGQSRTGGRRSPLYAVAAAPAVLALIVAIVGPTLLSARQASGQRARQRLCSIPTPGPGYRSGEGVDWCVRARADRSD